MDRIAKQRHALVLRGAGPQGLRWEGIAIEDWVTSHVLRVRRAVSNHNTSSNQTRHANFHSSCSDTYPSSAGEVE